MRALTATTLAVLSAALGADIDRTPPPLPLTRPAAHLPGAGLPGFQDSAHDFFGPGAPLETRCAPCHPVLPAMPPPVWDPDAAQRRRLASARPRHALAPSTVLCLSCHDGTIASEIVGGGSDPDLRAAGALIDFRRDHPVGVEYPSAVRMQPRIRRDYAPRGRLVAEGRIRLPDGRVECVSCHEPHNAWGHPDMLVKSNRRSALCLSCHLK